MTQTPRPQPQHDKIPMGKPIEWSDEQLDALSQVTYADILLAVEMWKRDLPLSGLRDLLDASPEGGEEGDTYGRF